MQQIFRRIKRILESERNFSNDLAGFESNDDELKRIIEELNQSKKQDNETNSNFRDNASDNYSKANDETSKSNVSINSIEDALRVLGLTINANDDEIRAGYLKKIKEYHPDKVQNLGEEIQHLANKKSKEINQAYEYIKNARNIK